MPTLNLHHYKNQKQPYVAAIIKDGASTKFQFLPKTQTKKSNDGTYGEFQITVDSEGFYFIGYAQKDENGFRLHFITPNGNKFPFICNQAVIDDIKTRIVHGNSISQIAKDLAL